MIIFPALLRVRLIALPIVVLAGCASSSMSAEDRAQIDAALRAEGIDPRQQRILVEVPRWRQTKPAGDFLPLVRAAAVRVRAPDGTERDLVAVFGNGAVRLVEPGKVVETRPVPSRSQGKESPR